LTVPGERLFFILPHAQPGRVQPAQLRLRVGVALLRGGLHRREALLAQSTRLRVVALDAVAARQRERQGRAAQVAAAFGRLAEQLRRLGRIVPLEFALQAGQRLAEALRADARLAAGARDGLDLRQPLADG